MTESVGWVDDIAFGVVEDFLIQGVEYLDISEAVTDAGGDDEDAEKVAIIVRLTLTELAHNFNIVNKKENN